jgi:ubiquinone biosynthesis protein COQ4
METVTNGRLHRPIAWKLAAKALIGLSQDTNRTDHVFTIIWALTGDSFERTFEAFAKTEHGKKLLQDKPSLAAVLADRQRLAKMPAGSLGRAYLAFMQKGDFTSDGLMDAQAHRVDPNAAVEDDPERQYVADRIRDMHDLWHVLTDYGSDDTGEIANLWFSVGQFGNPGMAFIAFFGMLDGRLDPTFGWPRYCLKAFQRGRRAARLVSEPVEDMLELPIAEARRRLGIAPTSEVHPEGIRRGYRKEHTLGALAA